MKIIKIAICPDCPHFKAMKYPNQNITYCELLEFSIAKDSVIPEECPLEEETDEFMNILNEEAGNEHLQN